MAGVFVLLSLSVDGACLPLACRQAFWNFAASVLPGIQIRFCIPVSFPAGIHRGYRSKNATPKKDGNLTGDISPVEFLPGRIRTCDLMVRSQKGLWFMNVVESSWMTLRAVGWGSVDLPRVVSISESY